MKTYNCDGLTGGGTRDLDTISVASLSDGDRAVCALANNIFMYFEFQSAATDAENTSTHPYKIRPDDYSSSGVWYEQMPHGIAGDGTIGRILRISRLVVTGEADAEITCQLISEWNGDAIASEANIAKSETSGDFSLDAGGLTVTIEASGLSGNVVAAFAQTIFSNPESYSIMCWATAISNDVSIQFRNAVTGADYDLTGMGAGEIIHVQIMYFTDA